MAVGSSAQKQSDGPQEDALSGAGFAGDHGEAVFQSQIQLFDEGVILYVKSFEHAGFLGLFLQLVQLGGGGGVDAEEDVIHAVALISGAFAREDVDDLFALVFRKELGH